VLSVLDVIDMFKEFDILNVKQETKFAIPILPSASFK
jgi:hypothetical protein